MIIEEKVKDLVVVGEDTSKKAKISQDKLAKLQYLLTKGLYKDPITAVIAEWTNNGIDSVVQAGKNPIENPVIVTINKDKSGQYTFRVEDKGVGLDDRDFEDICMNYLESTKENDNDTIGHFGIGMKSFLSLERSATFTCRKNGMERKYVVYEGEEFVNFDLVYCAETKEEAGVIAEIGISNYHEKTLFVDKAKSKLAYYDTAVLIIDGLIIENKIYRNELFQWSTLNTNNDLHICLKDVYYKIDYEALGITPIRFGVALRLGLSDGLTPTPSRESYITNEKARDLIMTKVKEVADWFIDRYNDTVKEFPDIVSAWEHIGNSTYFVRMYNNDFYLQDILKYSSKKLLKPTVKGVTLWDPLDYKNRQHELVNEYSAVGYLNYSKKMTTKSERIYTNVIHHMVTNPGKVVLVDNFRGNIREYLKIKYKTQTLFLRRNDFKRALGKSKEYGPNGILKIDDTTYRYVLDLGRKPRSEWKPRVEEWNFVASSVASHFRDETKIETSKEFTDWLEAKREDQRQQRALGRTSGTYLGLNKQTGDVTMAYSYKRYGKIHFKKEAFPIKDLTKNRYLTVMMTEDDNIELAKEIVLCMEKIKGVRFALLGKKEITKVPEHFQFINFKKFMSRDCKPFMRLASALKFQEAMKDLDTIKNYKDPVFAKALGTLNEDAKKIKKYVDINNPYYGIADTMKSAIIDVADEFKLYDLELWDVYSRLRANIKKYDFITLMNVPHVSNFELTKRYETLVNQILLFRKKFYNDLEGAEIVFKDKQEIDEVV